MPIGEVAYRLGWNEPVVCDHNTLIAARALLVSRGRWFAFSPSVFWPIGELETITVDKSYHMHKWSLSFDELRPEDQEFVRTIAPMLSDLNQGEQHQQAQEGRRS